MKKAGQKPRFSLFVQHERILMGESPKRALIAGSV